MTTDEVALALHDHPARPGAGWPVPATVLIHGWCCDSSDWDEFLPTLRSHSRVITLDLRGHGGSPDGTAHDAPTMARDVAAALDRLGLTGSLLVAHSAGTEVAMQLVVDRPDLAALAIVVDPAYGVPDARREQVAVVGRELVEHEPREVVARYFAAIPEPAALARRHRELALRARPRTAREMFLDFNLGPSSWHFESDARRFLAQRSLPVLAIYRSAERAAVGATFATRPGDLVLNYDSGHWPHQEQPERFLADVERWVGATLSLDAKEGPTP
jgi:pimeloyl-ACP methyl ester carboxylesterase